MKQHLFGSQLKEIEYNNRIVLISLVTGIKREYVEDEYNKGIKREEDMLRKYAYNVNIGELIEIIENNTGQFPVPIVNRGEYKIYIEWMNSNGDKFCIESDIYQSYCDALFEIVKKLFISNNISVI